MTQNNNDFNLESIEDFGPLNEPVILRKRYKVNEKIGEGGTSNIFKGVDLETDNVIALKIIKKNSKVVSAKKRFELEAETLLSFKNPNIVKIYDYFSLNYHSIIVMEYLKGKTLKQIIRKQKFLSIEQTLNYLLKIINALKDLHEKNIMHRDLKPQNIIIDDDNTLKLMDFGIIQASEEQDITQTNYVVGSVEYMAPEVLKGKKATPRSEIYSLGIIAYMMLTGVTPLKGSDFQETAKNHLSKKADNLFMINPDIDEKLNNIVLKMLRINDFERYQDVIQLEDVVKNYLEDREVDTVEKKILEERRSEENISIWDSDNSLIPISSFNYKLLFVILFFLFCLVTLMCLLVII